MNLPNTMKTSSRPRRNRPLAPPACLALLVCCVTAAPAQDRPRELPPTDTWPRTRAEWQRLKAAREECGPGFKDCLPEYSDAFDRMQEWLEFEAAKYTEPGVVFDEQLADQLIADLYIDHGHPILNAGAQTWIVGITILKVARWPADRLPPEARERLAAGLVEYACAGGGQQYCPSTQAQLSEALYLLAPGDREAEALADELLSDALAWAYEVDYPAALVEDMVTVARRRWGDAAVLWAYDISLGRAALPPRPPRRYRTAVEALRSALAETSNDADLLAKRVRAATRAALVPLPDGNLRDDLLCRLLLVYRTLLERKPPIPARLSAYIEQQLIRVTRNPGLRTERHWNLWADALHRLGDRASEATRRRLLAMSKASDLPPPARRALEGLEVTLRLRALDARPAASEAP